MSDPTEPPRPEGPSDVPGAGSGDAPPPPPPSGYGAPAPPPPSGDDPYGGAAGPGGYGDGGYGAPPPPPPGGPFGPPQPAGYSPTEAIGYGWRKFMASPGTLLIPTLVAWVGIAVVGVLVYLLLLASLNSTGFVARLLVSGLATGIFFVVVQLLTAGLYRGAVRVVDGQDFSVGQMLEGYDKGQVLIASLLIGVATAIGSVLCYIPGLIVGFLTFFTLVFVVDRHLSAVDAIKASYTLVTENLASTLVFYILAGLVLLVSACICGIGLLVGIPVALLGLAYTYRRLQGEPVTAA